MKSDTPFFVAEVSANHLGRLDRALDIVQAAAQAGASAIKLQTYKPETMTLDISEFSVSKDHPLWGGRKLFDLYREAFTPWEWHKEIFEFSRSLGLVPFSSPFDETAVELLESIDCPIYKIASLESGDLNLIKLVAETGKPIIASTGATTLQEIEELVDVVRNTSSSELTLLVCTSSYPASPQDANLRRIDFLKKHFGVKVGVSDHSLGIGVALAGIALGATVIEKHLTLARSDGGADGAFSMEPHEFGKLVTEGTDAFHALGNSDWVDIPAEDESRSLRRSLYVVKEVVKGDLVTKENVRAIRPGQGSPPRLLSSFLGQRFNASYFPGQPLSSNMLME